MGTQTETLEQADDIFGGFDPDLVFAEEERQLTEFIANPDSALEPIYDEIKLHEVAVKALAKAA